MDFAQRLKELMKRDGLSNYELAKRIDIHQSTIANWLDGSSMPRMKTQKVLANYFGVPLDYLLGNEEVLVNNDPELTEYLNELKTRPEMRMLFSLASSATKEDVEKAVKIIEAFLKD